MVSQAVIDRVLALLRHDDLILPPQPAVIDVDRIMSAVRHVSLAFPPEPVHDVQKIPRAVRKVSSIGDLETPVDEAFYHRSPVREFVVDTRNDFDYVFPEREYRGGHSDAEGDSSSWGPEWDPENTAPDKDSSEEPDSSEWDVEHKAPEEFPSQEPDPAEWDVENKAPEDFSLQEPDPADWDAEIEAPEEFSSQEPGSSDPADWDSEIEAPEEFSLQEPDSSAHSEEEANVGDVVECEADSDEICSPSRLSNKLLMCPDEDCNRQYISRGSLLRHSDLAHGGKGLVCTWEECDYTFNDSLRLEIHLKVHEERGADLQGMSMSPDALIYCPARGCNQQFRYRSKLNYHIEHVHDGLSEANGMPDSEDELEAEYPWIQLATRPGSRRKRVKLDHDDDLLPKYDSSPPRNLE